MSPPSSHTLSSQLNSTVPAVDLDALYAQPAYITNLDGFLSEEDDYKALLYWLTEFEITRQLKAPKDIIYAIHRTIARLDEQINDQLNAIIHHEKFQQLEASWRGLWFLAVQSEGATNIKVKVLNASWADVVKDVSRALEFDQSQLFHKIYSEEYGTPGGEPYGVLIGDYEISHRVSKKHPHDDISVLDGLAQIAAASFSPFIASASSQLFGMDDFAGLGLPLNLDSIFSQTEYSKWRALRDKIDSRFVGLTAPRILMRRPYRTKPGSYKVSTSMNIPPVLTTIITCGEMRVTVLRVS